MQNPNPHGRVQNFLSSVRFILIFFRNFAVRKGMKYLSGGALQILLEIINKRLLLFGIASRT